jgi:hypothetical protein
MGLLWGIAMKTSNHLIALLVVLIAASILSACSREEAAVEQSAGEPDGFEAQVAEYIRQFPYQETFSYVMRYTGGDPAKLNVWVPGGEPNLTLAGEDVVVRMNNDTYYNGAVVILDNGPVILGSHAPAEDRFYSFQLMDDRNVNYRNIIRPAGEYTLYFGEKPAEIRGEAIKAPSQVSMLLVRVEVKDRNDPKDVAAANEVYAGLIITDEQPSEHPQLDLLSKFPQEVVDEANRRIDRTFSERDFLDIVVRLDEELGTDVSYLEHAAATKGAWGAPDPSHSAYDTIFFDKNNEPFHGRNGNYAVTTEESPAAGFWSITAYDTERGGFFHPNDDDRYHWNGTTASRNDDGTFTFTFKTDCQTSDLNCLDVPEGQFDLLARYYLPSEEIISGEWTFPKIERISD